MTSAWLHGRVGLGVGGCPKALFLFNEDSVSWGGRPKEQALRNNMEHQIGVTARLGIYMNFR